MTNSKKLRGRLELNWVNKNKSLLYEYDEEGNPVRPKKWVDKDDIRVSEPRILKLKKEFGENDNENMLIKGDNLLALRSLIEEFRNRREKDKVNLIYIDPPFNTQSAFQDYDDNLEHSEWLTLMKDRLMLLKRLLRREGVICVHIDDTEAHYLKVLLDGVFGRKNYLATIYIQAVYGKKTLKQDRVFHDMVQQVLIYSKDSDSVTIKREKERYSFEKYNWYIKEKGMPWKTVTLGGKKVEIFRLEDYEIREGKPSEDGLKEIWASGTILDINSSGRFFRDHLMGRKSEDGLNILYKVFDIGNDKLPYRYFTGPKRRDATKGKYYQGVPKRVLEHPESYTKGKSIKNLWNMAGSFGNCRHEGGVELKSGKKPEILLKKLIEYFTDEGDVVLDSFLGSGTTAAVAHKMNRRWIGIELLPRQMKKSLQRLRYVINSENPDMTGISEDVNWEGGGGFRYYELGSSLISDKSELNWKLTKEEIARGVFMNFGYTFEEKLEDGVFAGNDKEKYAVCAVTKRPTLMGKAEIEGIIEKLEAVHGKNNVGQIDIYTNQGIKVKEDYLPGNVNIKKIPNSILERYNI